ncbi:MAG: pyruvoyl-dependent arginine decarboxylase [Candidatus Methanoplasma sp.]|jgi:arginine decarboxylase|nr:pyruvoyl-dependent arginine decarboxylase [Candidatus Methanoplasma sp.]
MHLTPSGFFVTSGKATSRTSDLNAFDNALFNAGISEQNLVAVSSVIPVGAKECDKKDLPMGAVTHCVLSQMRGRGGDVISAGIAYAYRVDGKGGYVAEGKLFGCEADLRLELESKMAEMSKMRGIEFGEIRTVAMEHRIPPGEYGCCVAALVFTEYG